MVEDQSTGVEFSRLVDAGEVKRAPRRIELSADEAARAAICARFAIEAVDRFDASISLRRTPVGLVHLQGAIEAEVVQQCVVSLEPVRSEISETFEIYYSEEGPGEASGDLPMDDELWPDPIVDGKIDVGEAATQQLCLALDPYPRREGVAHEGADTDPEPMPSRRPFAGLAEMALKRSDSDDER
jgi:uncharacterized metal-binding protein YceD (DUF177 family)